MNAHYIQNKILFDWISISSKIDSVDTIIELLGLDNVSFVDTYGLYGYKNRIIFDGIGIHFGGRTDTVLLEMSGQGCRAFESYGNGDYNSLFEYVLLHKDDVNITRLDIAYDDFNYLIDLESIKQDVIDGNFVCKCSSDNVGFEYTRKNGGSWTINAGKRGSNIYLRIYDKSKERNAMEEFPHWVRCEIQLRHSHAGQFINFLLNRAVYTPEGDIIIDGLRIDSLYFSVLNHFIRFIDKDCNNDTNTSRLPVKAHWAKFAHSVTTQRISLYVKPGVSYNILRLDHSVEEQYSGMIYTYIQCHGIQQLIDVVESKKYNLNTKYRDVISQRQAQLDEYWEKLMKDCKQL